MPRESTIQKNIMRWLKSLPNCEARNLHGSPFAVAGDPDIYGCIDGRMFLIEVKQPGQMARPVQARRLAEWSKAGAVVGVARSLEDAQEIVGPLLHTEVQK